LDQEQHKIKDYLRNNPLGADRLGRNYWLISHVTNLRGAIFVESEQDWFIISTEEQLKKLKATLNQKGIREKALLKSIESNYDLILDTFQIRRKKNKKTRQIFWLRIQKKLNSVFSN